MLVNSVYDSPDNGLCINLTDMLGCHDLTFHAKYTPAFNRQIFQHTLFPSVASAYGCTTETNASCTYVRKTFDVCSRCWLSLAKVSRRPVITSMLTAFLISCVVIGWMDQMDEEALRRRTQYSVSMFVRDAAYDKPNSESPATN